MNIIFPYFVGCCVTSLDFRLSSAFKNMDGHQKWQKIGTDNKSYQACEECFLKQYTSPFHCGEQ